MGIAPVMETDLPKSASQEPIQVSMVPVSLSNGRHGNGGGDDGDHGDSDDDETPATSPTPLIKNGGRSTANQHMGLWMGVGVAAALVLVTAVAALIYFRRVETGKCVVQADGRFLRHVTVVGLPSVESVLDNTQTSEAEPQLDDDDKSLVCEEQYACCEETLTAAEASSTMASSSSSKRQQFRGAFTLNLRPNITVDESLDLYAMPDRDATQHASSSSNRRNVSQSSAWSQDSSRKRLRASVTDTVATTASLATFTTDAYNGAENIYEEDVAAAVFDEGNEFYLGDSPAPSLTGKFAGLSVCMVAADDAAAATDASDKPLDFGPLHVAPGSTHTTDIHRKGTGIGKQENMYVVDDTPALTDGVVYGMPIDEVVYGTALEDSAGSGLAADRVTTAGNLYDDTPALTDEVVYGTALEDSIGSAIAADKVTTAGNLYVVDDMPALTDGVVDGTPQGEVVYGTALEDSIGSAVAEDKVTTEGNLYVVDDTPAHTDEVVYGTPQDEVVYGTALEDSVGSAIAADRVTTAGNLYVVDDSPALKNKVVYGMPQDEVVYGTALEDSIGSAVAADRVTTADALTAPSINNAGDVLARKRTIPIGSLSRAKPVSASSSNGDVGTKGNIYAIDTWPAGGSSSTGSAVSVAALDTRTCKLSVSSSSTAPLFSTPPAIGVDTCYRDVLFEASRRDTFAEAAAAAAAGGAGGSWPECIYSDAGSGYGDIDSAYGEVGSAYSSTSRRHSVVTETAERSNDQYGCVAPKRLRPSHRNET
ncbi:uncharacterized protein LOC135807176 [Sycon ciliatum]|uniref:uncharacterized protein LOC135807176 n=1 Tax=Sycon ciliatum TaxID=27933 RepID=UPI0031F6B6F9